MPHLLASAIAHHDLRLVALSYTVAVLAAYTGLDLTERITATYGRARRAWLIVGAVALGSGIWAMHFSAILAVDLGIQQHYDMRIVLLSLIVATGTSGWGLFNIRGNADLSRLLGSGLILGLGISAMHYLGIGALRLPGHIIYNTPGVALSIVIAVLGAVVALWLAFRIHPMVQPLRRWLLWKLGSACLMGGAIVGMHHAGMLAVDFTIDRSTSMPAAMHGTPWLNLLIAGVTIVLLSISVGTALIDRRSSARDLERLRLLESVVKHARDAVVVTQASPNFDQDSLIVYVNPAFEAITGYNAADVLSQPIHVLYSPDTDPAVTHNLQIAISEGRAVDVEFVNYRKDGTSFWMQLSVAPVVDGRGRTTHVMGIGRDVTVQHTAQHDLVEREARLRTLLDSTLDMITVIDADATIIDQSAAVEAVLGYARHDLLGTNALSYIHPADIESVRADLRLVVQKIPTGHNTVARFHTAHDEWRYLELVSGNLLDDPHIRGIVITSRDVTEHVQSAALMQQQNTYYVALHDTTLAIMQRLHPTDLLRAILTRAADLLHTEHGYIYLKTDDDLHMEMTVGIGLFAADAVQRVAQGEGIAGYVWQHNAPLVIDDYDRWPHRLPHRPTGQISSGLGIPLTVEAELVGVLGLVYTDPQRRFTAGAVDLISRFAQLGALALDNARLYHAAQQELDTRRKAETALLKVAEQRQQLLDVSHVLFSALSLEHVIERIQSALHKLIAYDSIGMYQIDRDANVLRPFLMSGSEYLHINIEQWTIPIDVGIIGSVMASGRAERVNNAHLDPRSIYPQDAVVTNEHLMIVPLRAYDQVVGTLGISRIEQPFSADEFELLQLFSTYMSLALENARLFAATERQAQELELLDKVRTALAREHKLPTMILTVVEAISQTFGYQQVSLYLLDNDHLHLQHQVGYPQVLDRIPITSGVMGRVARTGQPVLIRANDSDPEVLWAFEGLASEVCVPLHDQGNVVGVLNVETLEGITLDQADLRLMSALSEHISIAIGRARMYQETLASQEKYRSVVDNISEIIFQVDANGCWSFLNSAWTTVTGYGVAESIGTHCSAYIHPDDHEMACAEYQRLQHADATVSRHMLRCCTKHGESRWIDVYLQATHDSDGLFNGSSGTWTDVTVRKQAELLERDRNRVLELIAKNKPLPDILEQITVMIAQQRPTLPCAVLLLNNGRLYVGAESGLPAAITAALDGLVFGPKTGSCGPAIHERRVVIIDDIASDPRWAYGRDLALEHGLRASWSAPIVVNTGEVLGTFVQFDTRTHTPDPADLSLLEAATSIAAIALEHRQLTDQLAHQAHHDALTGLPNRVLFLDRLKQALAHARRYNQLVAVLFVDLDRFKQINDTLGHRVGDVLLQQVAQRLGSCIRQNDTLARISGDEFTLVLAELQTPRDAITIATKLLDALRVPFVVENHELFMTASIGISVYPQDGHTPADLQRNADIAMYRAKLKGRHCFQCFAPEMNATALQRLALQNHLRRALERNELSLRYQPQFELQTGELIGLEILLRWTHPELGPVSPGTFVPVAEETGLILPIGSWVLNEACRQLKTWQHAGYKLCRVAVNVSAVQFTQADFVDTVAAALRVSGLDPRWLELELTESLVMHEVEAVAERLAQLQALGVTISIDDFGTGYSSLAYLQRLPIDSLKVDQSFVRDISSPDRTTPHTLALIQTIVTLAHSLGMKAIAEGVESAEQRDFLRSIGCDIGQGYLFARPLLAEDVVALLAEPAAAPAPVPKLA